MPVDALIVTELRELFLNGATPSRLIRHIASRHEGESSWTQLVEPYFHQAFDVSTFFMEGRPQEVDLDSLDFDSLNKELLRDMVGRSAQWKSAVDDESNWSEGLAVATDDRRMIEALRPESHSALADSWPNLPPRVRDFIRQSMVNAQGYYEQVQVLSKLIERLQAQVLELEQQGDTART